MAASSSDELKYGATPQELSEFDEAADDAER
jgi:hypothetical protein